MGALSEAARDLCSGSFQWGKKCTVVSHKPHAWMTKRQAAVDELVAAGLITREPYNRTGSILLTGTDAAGDIGRKRAAEIAKREGWFS